MKPYQKLLPPRQGHKGINWCVSFISLIRVLQEEELTRDELMEIAGISNNTITKYLRLLHKPGENCIYISGWKRRGTVGTWSAIYKWGWLEKDSPRPKPMTKAEYHQRWKQKQRLKGFENGIRNSTNRKSELSI